MAAPPRISLPPRERREWTLQHVNNAVSLTYPGGFVQETADSINAYLRGEHFQDGKYWMGAGKSAGGVWETGAKSLVESQFTPVPEGFACLEQRVNGACGNEAAFSLQAKNPGGVVDAETGNRPPSAAQAAYIERWEAEAGPDWTERGIWGSKDIRKPTGVRGMVAQASAHQSGSACIRAFFNPASRTDPVLNAKGEETGRRIPKQPDRASALRHIPIVAPPPDRCCVYVDPDTLQETGIFLFTDADDKPAAELWFAEGGKTILRTVREGADSTVQDFPWGGWLPIQQANVGTLWTDAVLRLQRQLDTDATATGRTLLAQAYGQRTEINAEEDGEWMLTAPPGVSVPRKRDPKDGTPVQYFNPRSAELGPGVNRRLTGIPYTASDDGTTVRTGLTTPSVHEKQPTSPEANILGMGAFLVLLRDACHQGHRRSLIGGSTAEASGDAYEQARAAFLADIKGVAEAVDACVAKLLTVRTVMADWLCEVPNPAQFAVEYAVIVQSHPDAGAPTSGSQQETRENVKARLLSPKEGMARLGIQDVGAETTEIEQSSTLDVEERRIALVVSAAGAGLNPIRVLMRTGLTEKEATELAQSDGLPNVEQ